MREWGSDLPHSLDDNSSAIVKAICDRITFPFAALQRNHEFPVIFDWY